MATIAEQLTSLADTKTAIKDAIVAKGVSVSDTDTFASYATKIGEISGGGGSSSKYGLSLDSLLGDTVDGVLLDRRELPLSQLTFNGVEELAAYSLTSAFGEYARIESVSFPDLVSASAKAAYKALSDNGFVTSINLGNLETVYSEAFASFVSNSYGRAVQETSVSGLEKIKTIDVMGMKSFAQGRQCVLRDEAPFSVLESVGESGLSYAFYGGSTVGNIDLKSLTTVGASGLQWAFGQSNISSFKANAITTLTANNTFNQACRQSNGLSVLEFKSLKSIEGSSAFQSFLDGATHQVTTLEFPELESITGSSAFSQFFAKTSEDSVTQRILFPKLKTITGGSTFRHLHNGSTFGNPTGMATPLVQIDFHSLQTLGSATEVFYYAFVGHNLYHIDFGSLETTSGSKCFYGAFLHLSNGPNTGILMSVDFSCLKTIATGTFQRAFENNVSLPRITFPSLTSVHNASFASSATTTTQDAFNGCTGLTEIHFLKSMESTISGIYGYSRKFGATNATIYFDLVGAITVNGVVYNRSEANSLRQEDATRTKTHIAWADESGNLVYTASFRDTQEPYVGTEVYSSDGYTQVGTVEAIA